MRARRLECGARAAARRRLVGASLEAVAMAALIALCGCDRMKEQPRYDSYEPSALFADGKSLQAPPDGTIARDDPAWIAVPEMSLALLQRGRERYEIYCSPCHDYAGYGHGTVPSRGFPQPPSFHIERLREAPSSHFVEVITQGHGVMYSYADRVPPADRWAIAAYIRALQLSQFAPVDALEPRDKARLQRGGP